MHSINVQTSLIRLEASVVKPMIPLKTKRCKPQDMTKTRLRRFFSEVCFEWWQFNTVLAKL